MITALHNIQIISDGHFTRGKAILISDGTIAGIVSEDAIPQDAEKTDMQGAFVAPGLIDLQIYGSGGKLLSIDIEPAALLQMENDLIKQGTTGFFATISTNTDTVIEQTIEVARNYRQNRRGNFLGLHLEGPFLNPVRNGAHNREYIKKASLNLVQKWIEMADGVITMMTIAPELQDKEVIDYLHDNGVILSSGHSNATYAEGKSFLNNPIPAVTHLYNAMPQMHHREPGYIPAIFEEKPYTSIVPDGIHVDFVMARLAKRELGNKLFFITDAVTETNHGPYQHQFKGDRYVLPDGTLSGSSLTMLKAAQNGVKHFGIDLAEAINMASLYPAQLAKLNKGKVEAGFDADLIVFDIDFNVKATFLAGKLVR
jgi:N-acetylglucosamine-6-phosphate deacetylase